jgi:glucokinase
MDFKPSLLADLGATNARFAITEDGFSYQNSKELKISEYNSMGDLCIAYLSSVNASNIRRGFIGVAAPVIGDVITFINCDLEFSQSELQSSLFPEGLKVINDLALQAHAVNFLEEDELECIGKKFLDAKGPRILVVPGTGLGMAGIVNEEVVSTEAGHLNIPAKIKNKSLDQIIEVFRNKTGRMPTFEDFLSGKGLNFFYCVLSDQEKCSLTNEEILSNYNTDAVCLEVKESMNYLYAAYLRYLALAWGALGGVYLAGSITNSLLFDIDDNKFRQIFEDSETMNSLLKATPIFRVKPQDIGFRGALKLAREL